VNGYAFLHFSVSIVLTCFFLLLGAGIAVGGSTFIIVSLIKQYQQQKQRGIAMNVDDELTEVMSEGPTSVQPMQRQPPKPTRRALPPAQVAPSNFPPIESSTVGVSQWELMPPRPALPSVLQASTEPIWGLTALGQGREFLSVSLDGTCRQWGTDESKDWALRYQHTQGLSCLMYVPSEGHGALVAGSLDGKLFYESAARYKGGSWKEISIGTSPVLGVAYLRGAKERAVAGELTGRVTVWDLRTTTLLATLAQLPHPVWCVGASQGGRFLAFGYGPQDPSEEISTTLNYLHLWDMFQNKEIARLIGHTAAVRSVAFSPNGKELLSGSADGTARLWDAATGREIRRFEGHLDWVRSVAFHPRERLMATGSDDETVRLWNLETGHEVKRFTGHAWSVTAVTFTQDGEYLLSASDDGTIRAWPMS
jgi:WD40 repeat protein